MYLYIFFFTLVFRKSRYSISDSTISDGNFVFPKIVRIRFFANLGKTTPQKEKEIKKKNRDDCSRTLHHKIRMHVDKMTHNICTMKKNKHNV